MILPKWTAVKTELLIGPSRQKKVIRRSELLGTEWSGFDLRELSKPSRVMVELYLQCGELEIGERSSSFWELGPEFWKPPRRRSQEWREIWRRGQLTIDKLVEKDTTRNRPLRANVGGNREGKVKKGDFGVPGVKRTHEWNRGVALEPKLCY